MRGIYNHLLTHIVLRMAMPLCMCASVHAFAQNPPAAGFFSVVNAVDLTTNTLVSVDGKPLRPDGLKPGKVTGGLGFISGKHRLDVTNADCKPSSLSLDVTEGSSPIVIIYMVSISRPGAQPLRELHLFVRGNTPTAPDKKTFSVIYAGAAASQPVTVNGQMKALRPLIDTPVGEASSLIIVQNGQSVASIAPDVAGKYVAVLFDGQDSRLKAVLAEDAVLRRAGTR
jgi:hypothetical protein